MLFDAKVSIIINSHISNVQENPTNPENNKKLNFVKFLILKYKDTSVEVDGGKEWDAFVNAFPNL
jgi:hypothetical protein